MYKLPDLNKLISRFKNRVYELFQTDYIVLEIRCFDQTFSNTATILENGGFNGQAITEEFISVFIDLHNDFVQVYGNNELAYEIKKPNGQFFNDLKNCNLKTVKNSGKYITKEK